MMPATMPAIGASADDAAAPSVFVVAALSATAALADAACAVLPALAVTPSTPLADAVLDVAAFVVPAAPRDFLALRAVARAVLPFASLARPVLKNTRFATAALSYAPPTPSNSGVSSVSWIAPEAIALLGDGVRLEGCSACFAGRPFASAAWRTARAFPFDSAFAEALASLGQFVPADLAFALRGALVDAALLRSPAALSCSESVESDWLAESFTDPVVSAVAFSLPTTERMVPPLLWL